jgi:hypothetical protein
MSSSLLRIAIAVILIAHGIGHTLGLFPLFGWGKSDAWTGQSWLFTGLLGDTPARWLGALIWIAATLGFIAAGMGILGFAPLQAPWRTVAVASSILSLVGVLFYWNGFPDMGPRVGALAVDIVALAALLVMHWPPPEMIAG